MMKKLPTFSLVIFTEFPLCEGGPEFWGCVLDWVPLKTSPVART